MENPDVKVLFGSRMRFLRQAKGWSQEEFAYRIGLDRSYVGGIERGERNVTLEKISLIAAGLEISLSKLLEFETSGSCKEPPNASV